MGGIEQDETPEAAADPGRAVLEALVRVALPDAVDPSSQAGPAADAPTEEAAGSAEAR